MTFNVLERWKEEFSKKDALAVAQGLLLPEELTADIMQFYEELCNDFGDDLDSEDLSDNELKTYFCGFLTSYKKSLQGGHSHRFSFYYASNFYTKIDNEAEAKDEAYQAVGKEAVQEAINECRALARSVAYTKKYVESISNRERESDAVRRAEKYEKAFIECKESEFSEVYTEQYADQRASYDGDDSEYAHAFAHCYELRLKAGDSAVEARGCANDFTDFLGANGTTSFGWMRAAVSIIAERFAEQAGFDKQKYTPLFAMVFAERNPVVDEDFMKCAEKVLSGQWSLDIVKDEATKLYEKMLVSRIP